MTTKWLFVYGTLRPGYGNDVMLQDGILEAHEVAHTDGRLYHVHGGTDRYPIFPVADFDEKGTVHGTLLLVRAEHPGVMAARRMELRAGYEEREVAVRVEHEEGDFEVAATAYHYVGEWRGDRIQDGDWSSVATSREEIWK